MRNIDNQNFIYQNRYSSLPADSPDRFSSVLRPRIQRGRLEQRPKAYQDNLDLVLLKIGAITAIVTIVVTITLVF